ncbi:MAG TPA: helix-turn-helix domain-containing protein [Candidatus Binataceae bacterium]|nr:helix-turn-helix domain-containing protein [Candidatus Binataceae bacterium]
MKIKRKKLHRIAERIGTRARRAARTRDEIVRAGLKVFSEKGFHGATMDDIALELDATKGLVYYYFNTKEDILAAIIADNPLTAGVENLIAAVKGMPIREGLRDAFMSVRKLLDSNRQLVRFLFVQSALSEAKAKAVYSGIIEKIYKMAAELVESAKQTGDVRSSINSNGLAKFVVDFLTAEYIGDSETATESQRDIFVDQVIDVLINGIATAQGRDIERGVTTASHSSVRS